MSVKSAATKPWNLFSRKPISAKAAYFSTGTNENFQVPVNIPEPAISSKNVAQFRKGAGGRASFNGNVITVFGNSGFTGEAVVNRLAKQGTQLIIPYRCDPYFVKDHKVVGELGQILFFPFELRDENSIRKAVKYSNVVVNLIGSFFDTPNYTMHDTNVEGARTVARISKEMGVERLVHLSILNADVNHESQYLKNGQFLRTKAQGELAVREVFPEATIVRPSVIYGLADYFIHKLTTYNRRCPIAGWVYVYNRGEGVYKMPTYINDFALAIARIATDPAMAGKNFELVGPYCYEMCELVDYIYRKAGCREEIAYNYYRFRYPDPWYMLQFVACKLNVKLFRSRNTVILPEWLDFLEATSDVLTGGNTLGYKDLGITPQSFENIGGWLANQRSFSASLELQFDEIKPPPLPLRSPPLYKPKPKLTTLEGIKTEQRVFGLGV